MPDVLTVLRDRLRTQPEVAALVGDSIYTHEVPHGVELPAIVMELRQATREATLAGYSGYEECDVGVTAIARSRETARAVLAAISTALEGYADFTTEPQIVRAWIESTRDIFTSPPDASEVGLYQCEANAKCLALYEVLQQASA
ncbi:MAG: hypothetical protein KatS3mg038_2802 [Candidatus Kapaibacterium sp.]|nr:MAG: hypothetical protein KatS3mg038_0391 [Candidatus Kapabacteria bacterium]GIV51842.1 MAG: hypothetical protein KatS3mg038_2363 [Candidatus Kapabacteria bacterium]GIV52281.1 MAG: hypothetical protein KatS3mg038_2802 [Candidatus Kapabacteria bacterium]